VGLRVGIGLLVGHIDVSYPRASDFARQPALESGPGTCGRGLENLAQQRYWSTLVADGTVVAHLQSKVLNPTVTTRSPGPCGACRSKGHAHDIVGLSRIDREAVEFGKPPLIRRKGLRPVD
jgi:hypothetical protein